MRIIDLIIKFESRWFYGSSSWKEKWHEFIQFWETPQSCLIALQPGLRLLCTASPEVKSSLTYLRLRYTGLQTTHLLHWPENEPGSLWDKWAPCTKEPGSESLHSCAPFTWLPGAPSSPGNGGTRWRVLSPFPHSGPKYWLPVTGQILHRMRALTPCTET